MKRALALILTAIFVFASVPLVASAADGASSVYVGGVELTNGKYLANGATSATSTKPSSGGYAYFKDGTLTLNNYEYTGGGVSYVYNPDSSDSSVYDTCIFADGDLEVVIEGENYLTNTAEYGECISVHGNLTVSGAEDAGLSVVGYYGLYAYSLYGSSEIRLNGGTICAKTVFSGFGIDVFRAGTCGYLIVDGAFAAAESEDYGVTIFGGDGSGRMLVKSGRFFAIGGISGVVIEAYESVDVYVENGDFGVLGNGYAGVDLYSESYATEFRHNGGTAYLHGVDYAVYADKSYIQGNRIEASYDPENATMEEAGLFSGTLSLSGKLVVSEGGFDQDYVIAEIPYTLGDVNDDGAIDQYDYILVKRHYFGTRILTSDEMLPADANVDGEVNQFDYILIKRHYFGTFTIG